MKSKRWIKGLAVLVAAVPDARISKTLQEPLLRQTDTKEKILKKPYPH